MPPRKVETVQRGLRHRDGTPLRSQRKTVKIGNIADLTSEEVEWSKVYAIFLKASGYSYSYISDSVGIQRKIVREWFDDEITRQRVSAIMADIADGGVQLLKHASLELVEILLEIARHSDDWSVKLKATESGLDRIGIAKLSKSESLATTVQKSTDDAVLQDIADLPFEQQQEAARAANTLIALRTKQPGGESV